MTDKTTAPAVAPAPLSPERRPARRFRIGMEPIARAVLAEQERDEAEAEVARLTAYRDDVLARWTASERAWQDRLDALTAENPTCLGHVPANPNAPFSEQRCGRCGQPYPCEVRRMWILWGQTRAAAGTFRAAYELYRVTHGESDLEPMERDVKAAGAVLDRDEAWCTGQTLPTPGEEVSTLRAALERIDGQPTPVDDKGRCWYCSGGLGHSPHGHREDCPLVAIRALAAGTTSSEAQP